MRDDVYKNIMRVLRSVTQDSIPHSRKCMDLLQKAYPMIPELTLESIYTLYYQRRMRIRHFKCKEMAEELYHRYKCAVANRESGILLRMSLEFDLAPALLARLILDQHFMSEDNKVNKCKSTLLVRKLRQPPSKLPNVSEESSPSHSQSQRTNSLDNNTCSEVSEDISVEECSEASKLSDDVSQPDSQCNLVATHLKYVATELHNDNETLPPIECNHILPLACKNAKWKPKEIEKILVSDKHIQSVIHKSDKLINERLVITDCVSSMPNGCPNAEEFTDAVDKVTDHGDVSSSKLVESGLTAAKPSVHRKQQTNSKILEEVKKEGNGRILCESAQGADSCNHPVNCRLIFKKEESFRNSKMEDVTVSENVEEDFRNELQELKNRLIELKTETKMLTKTDRPTTSDETGIEFSGMKRSISRLMKDTTMIQDKVLAHEVSMCVLYDDQYGPAATTYKHSLGQEYEVKLIKHAKAADLTFHLEARLREQGFDKTPDLLLIYPIAIGCNVVNWIESKALFADREVHSMYFVHQYERYCSRYGPGLVIYWFGFVESLREDDPFILVRDNFPKYIKHMNLLVDDASDCEANEENGALPEWEVAEPSSEEMTKFLERFSS